MTWYEWILALLPLISIPLGLNWMNGGEFYRSGGLFWMLVGLTGAFINVRLFRSKLSGLNQYVGSGIITFLSLGIGLIAAIILYDLAGGAL